MKCNRQTTLLSILCLSLIVLGGSEPAQADRAIRSIASGTGAFIPRETGDGGYYFGPGTETRLGDLVYSGSLDLQPIQQLKFRFQNTGRGTDDETLHEVIYEDGSTVSSRFRGIVELVPEIDGDGNPTGRFTAEWNGTWVYVKGTGRFRGVRGSIRVTAVNEPFFLTDLAWNFSWTWQGNIAVPNNPNDDCEVLTLASQGTGVFDPANLGVGTPDFPFVIGDGSGEGIYDGTPVGVANIDGMIGPDQHWGTAQSISPGIVSPAATLWYPGVTGANPRSDAGSQLIHIMAVELSKGEVEEIWFNYNYYFDLDLEAGLIVGRADFRVVGGTGRFEGAGGSVFVRVESDLDGFDPNNPVAPFDYDFKGYIELCEDK